MKIDFSWAMVDRPAFGLTPLWRERISDAVARKYRLVGKEHLENN